MALHILVFARKTLVIEVMEMSPRYWFRATQMSKLALGFLLDYEVLGEFGWK